MMKKQYKKPELVSRRLWTLETFAAGAESGNDNDLDIGDTDWGDFEL